MNSPRMGPGSKQEGIWKRRDPTLVGVRLENMLLPELNCVPFLCIMKVLTGDLDYCPLSTKWQGHGNGTLTRTYQEPGGTLQ